MNLLVRRFAWLLPLVLCACAHNPKQMQTTQALAPPIEETPPPPDLAPTALPQPTVSIPSTPQPIAVPPEPVKVTPKHHRSSAKAASQAAAQSAQPGTVAESTPAAPAEENAMGKFETPEAPDIRKQTESSIAEIERGLNGIGRRLNDQETKTTVQIREFIKQARTALSSGDVDGANTLAKKAKALFGELSQ